MRSMKPNLSSPITSPFHCSLISGSPHTSLRLRRPPPAAVPPRRRPSSSHPSSNIFCAANSSNEGPLGLRRIGDESPPWLVDPPLGGSSSDDGELLFDLHAGGSFVGRVPFSLRFVQLRKKLSRQAPGSGQADRLGTIGKAVHSLASAMEEIQQAVLSDGEGSAAARAAAESVVFLFRNVYCSSPGFFVGLLVLASNYLAISIEKAMMFQAAVDGGGLRSWRDVGILEAGENGTQKTERKLVGSKQLALAYENMIASGMTSSLILCNYAQLLYEYEKDIERAQYYFEWATTQEPADAEAMNKYAFFLWQEVGDLEAAEEMFAGAVEAEPAIYFYRCSYAFFLWNNGGTDTCFSPVE